MRASLSLTQFLRGLQSINPNCTKSLSDDSLKLNNNIPKKSCRIGILIATGELYLIFLHQIEAFLGICTKKHFG